MELWKTDRAQRTRRKTGHGKKHGRKSETFSALVVFAVFSWDSMANQPFGPRLSELADKQPPDGLVPSASNFPAGGKISARSSHPISVYGKAKNAEPAGHR
jgi:hypothetical protein